VGIGTATPVSKLDVVETATIKRTTSGNNMDLNFYNGSGAGTAGNVSRIRSDGDGISNDYGALSFWTGRIATAAITERMRIDSSGNVGIGVTPSAWFSNSRVIQIGTGGSVAGRSNDASVVELSANQFINTSGTRTYISTAVASLYEQNSGQHRFFTAASGTAGNAISFTQAMTLDASGNLGIGGTAAAGVKLHIESGDAQITLKDNNTNKNSSPSTYINFEAANARAAYLGFPGVNDFYINNESIGALVFSTQGSDRVRIDSSGNVRFNAYGAGALTTDASGNITAVSDERIKSNIRPFSRGLAEILAINPILHGYTEESGLDQTRDDYAGFSAQQVQQIIPEAIGENADGMLSFSDRPVMAALVNAMKELNANLVAQVAALSQRLAALEKSN
jgi:hypothetical protein